MKTKLFVGLLLLTFWRVGQLVNWQLTTFIGRFSADRAVNYTASEATCAQGIYCSFTVAAAKFRSLASDNIQAVLPSPHSELVMGMVLGENRFAQLPKYNDILKTVGLVHVVVVSGYNISLVFTLLMRMLGSHYKARNLLVGLLCTFMYSGISGFGVPAVRAWLMGSVAVIFKFYGRPVQGTRVLMFSALVMLCAAPEQLFTVSFMLSFLATLGVMVVPEALKVVWRLVGIKIEAALFEDFNTSLSAQLMVNPVIAYYFGTVSLVALIANPLVLWVVPLCTVVGGMLVFFTFVCPAVSRLLALLLYPFLDVFVSFSEFFSSFNSASLHIDVGLYGILLYYLILVLGVRLARKASCD
jgi:competence protein ComEC